MRTNANWLVCYNTQGRAQEMEGGGAENVVHLRGKMSTQNIVKACCFTELSGGLWVVCLNVVE